MDSDLARDFYLYLRKSNGRKAVPRQRVITTGHIADRGGRITAEFADTDKTAFRKPAGDQPEREDFARMLSMLAANPGTGVAAWHADRLTRNDEDTAALIRVCAAGNHFVVTPSGGTYDLSTANGRRRFRDDASAAIYEVDHGRERVLAGRADVAAQGRWLGGKRPFGWEPDPDPALLEDRTPWLDEDGKPVKGILRLRPDEAAALARGCRDVLAGATLAAIARDWNARGILTSEGKQWRPAEAGRVLRRPRNAGLMEHNGQITGKAQWPAAVDETTWRGAAAILADTSRRTSPGPASRHLLSWIARCGVCGGPVICTSSTRKGRESRLVYRCREDKRGHLSRDKALLDQLVARLVAGWFAREDAAGILIRPDDGRKRELAALYAEKAEIEDRMLQRDKLHRKRVITDRMLEDGLAELREELAGIEARIAAAAQADVLMPMIGDPAQVWEGMSLDQRRAVVRRLMTITLLPSRRGLPLGWRPGESYFDPESVRIGWLI